MPPRLPPCQLSRDRSRKPGSFRRAGRRPARAIDWSGRQRWRRSPTGSNRSACHSWASSTIRARKLPATKGRISTAKAIATAKYCSQEMPRPTVPAPVCACARSSGRHVGQKRAVHRCLLNRGFVSISVRSSTAVAVTWLREPTRLSATENSALSLGGW